MKKIKTLSAIALTAFALSATPSVAAANGTFGDAYTECGIGALFFPSNDTLAAITNVTWDLGTTAVSSNYSSEDACNGSSAETAMFIHESYDILEANIAQGEGEHLNALMTIAGCESSATTVLREEFGQVVTAKYYSEKDAVEKSEALYNIVSAACSV